ncbi:hypothetical protein SAMN03159341_1556 [Paenibacillus sp. 1_12]|uniref:hypothetical protein n=1 Tax=Paenibacillus sp. 1_12 TaxID=1566278 RepID=UPI0008E2F706|nr:hypothetical protein [Paenibacillus sp. 1_12]SFM57015.1 hypothetical protein SAMN03159341_1556 [Paenibacillus sp. 1_12]
MLETGDINNIIKNLYEKGLFGKNIIAIKNRTGSTDGHVYILSENNEEKYVLKIDRPQQITLAEDFLNTYRHIILLPKILYTDPEKAFVVYSYIAGTTHKNRCLKINWLTILAKELFNQYEKSLQTEMWGRIQRPIQTWSEWNYRSLEGTRDNWGSLLTVEDYDRVRSIVENISNCAEHESRYLLYKTNKRNTQPERRKRTLLEKRSVRLCRRILTPIGPRIERIWLQQRLEEGSAFAAPPCCHDV